MHARPFPPVAMVLTPKCPTVYREAARIYKEVLEKGN